MNDIEYYIDIIKDEEGWKPITNDLINEILENNKLYGFTLDNDDLKSIIDTLKDRLYHKKIKLLKSDIELLIKSDKKIYDKFKEITKKKTKTSNNIPFDILDFIDYKNELIYIIKYS